MSTDTVTTTDVLATNHDGVPTSVDPGPDLGRKPDGDAFFWTDSIYITGRLHAEGQPFGYLVHVLRQPARGAVVQSVSVVEEAEGRFRHHQEMPTPDGLAWSETGLELRTEQLTWTGDDDAQRLSVTFPGGALDLQLDVQGPVLFYGGGGTWPMIGFQQYQYALTGMRTHGTLTLDGRSHPVTGESWLDRQWGNLADATVMRWTWFNFALPNGDKLAVWDILPAAGDPRGIEQAWATLVHSDGTHELLPVTPLAQDAGRPWTSPVTGKTYPTRWTVRVPSRDTVLDVVADLLDQELPALAGGIYEGLATVTGVYQGEPVTLKTYVEQVGNWL